MFHEKVCQYQLSWDKSWKFIHHFHCFHINVNSITGRLLNGINFKLQLLVDGCIIQRAWNFRNFNWNITACPHHTRVMMIFIQSGKFPVGTLPLFGREQWTYNLNSVHFNLWIKFEEYVSVCVNYNSILKFSLDNQVVFMLLFLRVCIRKVTSI